MVARVNPDQAPKNGETTRLWVDTSKLHFFDLDTGLRSWDLRLPSRREAFEGLGERKTGGRPVRRPFPNPVLEARLATSELGASPIVVCVWLE